MAAYCAPTDLLTGDIPLPTYIDPAKVVQDAADEIDSKIGFVYLTPVDVTDTGPAARPVKLLLKRLNVFIATGRLLMNVDTAGEESNVHQYGLYLLKEAEAALLSISNGTLKLEGVPYVNANEGGTAHVPIIGNKDTESSVDAFYDRIANPAYLFRPTYVYPQYNSPPESFVR